MIWAIPILTQKSQNNQILDTLGIAQSRMGQKRIKTKKRKASQRDQKKTLRKKLKNQRIHQVWFLFTLTLNLILEGKKMENLMVIFENFALLSCFLYFYYFEPFSHLHIFPTTQTLLYIFIFEPLPFLICQVIHGLWLGMKLVEMIWHVKGIKQTNKFNNM